MSRWLPLLLPAAEVAWMIPWLLLASGVFYPSGHVPILAPRAVAALVMGGYLVAGGLMNRPWPARRTQAVLIAAALGLGFWAVWTSHYAAVPLWHPRWLWALLEAAHGALPSIPVPVMAGLAAPLLFWRGLVLGSREFSHFEAERAFRRGMAWSAVFVVLFSFYAHAAPFRFAQPVAGGDLLAFVFLSLLLLAGARLLSLWEERRGTAHPPTANRPWFPVLVGIVTLIVVVGGVAGMAAGADTAAYLRPLLRALVPVLEAIFLVLFLIASVIARLILLVLTHLPRYQRQVQSPSPPDFSQLLQRIRDLEFAPGAVSVARWVMVLGVIVLLAAAIAFVRLRGRRMRAREDPDEHESVWDGPGFWHGLRRLFRRRPGGPAAGEGAADAETQAIRLLYRGLLRLAQGAGWPRRAHQTPREFRGVLGESVAQARGQIEALTAAYERVRYGEARPSAEEVERARRWLETIRHVLHPEDGAGLR